MAKITDPALLSTLNSGMPAQAQAPAALPPVAAPAVTPKPTAAAPYAGDALGLLRDFEGFRETPYWDVNAYRTGYGSDTITKADGSVVKVQQGMRVNRDDAERDLARRSAEFANTASGQVGADNWATLPPNARAALTSVAYNYGSLPKSVVAAAKTGDVNAVADAVYGLRNHNEGVNAQRREREAAIIRGEDYTPSSASYDPSVRPSLLPSSGANAAPLPSSVPAGAKKVTDPMALRILNGDATFTPQQATVAAPVSAAPPVATPAPVVAAPVQAAVAPAPVAVPAPTPGALAAAPGVVGFDAMAPAADPALSQPQPEWQAPGVLAPIQVGTNPDGSTAVRPAVPQVVSGAWSALVNAVTAPGRAASGDPAFQPTIDPTTGAVNAYPDAMVSAATDAAGLMIGNGPGMAGKGMVGAVADPMAPAVARQVAADEFGIPLTQGQAAQDVARISGEEVIRNADNAAGKVVRNFDTGQQAAIGEAVDQIGAKAGSNGGDVGPTVMNALNKIVSDQRAKAEELYGKAFGGNLTIPSSEISLLPETVAARLASNDVYVDQIEGGGITPVANAAMRIIDETAANLPVTANGTVDVVQSLNTIERLRRRLVGLEGNSGEDRAAVREIKAGFDEWLDTAVDRALITGDDDALQALKDARSEWSTYKQLSTAKPGDQAQSAVVKMQKQDATAEEVANWLYGADIASPSLAAPKVAQRIKSIVGEDSDAWKAVRASAFERLTLNPNTGDKRTALVMSNRIDQFLNNKGQTLSRVLFSDEQISELKRFSDVLKSTVTPKAAQNPSRTAFTLMNSIKKLSGDLAGVGGAVVGGPAVGVAAALAFPVFRNAKEMGKAVKAVTRVEPAKASSPVAKSGFSAGANALARSAIVAPEAEPAEQANDNVLYTISM